MPADAVDAGRSEDACKPAEQKHRLDCKTRQCRRERHPIRMWEAFVRPRLGRFRPQHSSQQGGIM
eukprot:2559643-Pleurochrysis_carterae.AAC.1